MLGLLTGPAAGVMVPVMATMGAIIGSAGQAMLQEDAVTATSSGRGNAGGNAGAGSTAPVNRTVSGNHPTVVAAGGGGSGSGNYGGAAGGAAGGGSAAAAGGGGAGMIAHVAVTAVAGGVVGAPGGAGGKQAGSSGGVGDGGEAKIPARAFRLMWWDKVRFGGAGEEEGARKAKL